MKSQPLFFRLLKPQPGEKVTYPEYVKGLNAVDTFRNQYDDDAFLSPEVVSLGSQYLISTRALHPGWWEDKYADMFLYLFHEFVHARHGPRAERGYLKNLPLALDEGVIPYDKAEFDNTFELGINNAHATMPRLKLMAKASPITVAVLQEESDGVDAALDIRGVLNSLQPVGRSADTRTFLHLLWYESARGEARGVHPCTSAHADRLGPDG